MAATMEANHGLLQDVLVESDVLKALVNANKFNIDATNNLLFLPRNFDLADATGVVRHAGNHVPVGDAQKALFTATVGNIDVAQFHAGIAMDQLWFKKSGNSLDVSIIGSSDKFVINNWYLGGQYHVEQFKTSDGKVLLDSQVQILVNAMSAFSPPTAGQTTLPANYASSLNPVIAANWH